MLKNIKNVIRFFAICAFAAAAAFAVQVNTGTDDAASARVKTMIIDAISTKAAPNMALTEPSSEGFSPCNQGAYCTSRRDPACGFEGFCNLSSNCCMCY